MPSTTSGSERSDRFPEIYATLPNDRGAEPGLTIAMHCGHINDRNTPRTGP